MNLQEKRNKYLHNVRELEFEQILKYLPENANDKSLLEIGAGTGYQLLKFKNKFKNAIGVDIKNSNYRSERIKEVEIVDYDGIHLPFEEESFDVIFSSNTMEHIINLKDLEKEMMRVLKPNGICIHLIPSHVWKIWNILFHYPMLYKAIQWHIFRKKQQLLGDDGRVTDSVTRTNSNFKLLLNVLFAPLHGERGNRFTEVFYFHPKWWKTHFEQNGWIIVKIVPTGVGYSGYNIFKNINRVKLAELVGSSCYTYILKK